MQARKKICKREQVSAFGSQIFNGEVRFPCMFQERFSGKGKFFPMEWAIPVPFDPDPSQGLGDESLYGGDSLLAEKRSNETKAHKEEGCLLKRRDGGGQSTPLFRSSIHRAFHRIGHAVRLLSRLPDTGKKYN
jgi:hypothetical protein